MAQRLSHRCRYLHRGALAEIISHQSRCRNTLRRSPPTLENLSLRIVEFDLLHVDLRPIFGQNPGPLQHMFQLAHVSGPAHARPASPTPACADSLHRSGPSHILSRMCRCQRLDILLRALTTPACESEIPRAGNKGPAETPLPPPASPEALDASLPQFARPRCTGPLFPTRCNFPAFQKPQQLCLQPQGHLANFIKEERAAMRRFNASGAPFHSAGERAARMAEELGLQQGRPESPRSSERSASALTGDSAGATRGPPVPCRCRLDLRSAQASSAAPPDESSG